MVCYHYMLAGHVGEYISSFPVKGYSSPVVSNFIMLKNHEFDFFLGTKGHGRVDPAPFTASKAVFTKHQLSAVVGGRFLHRIRS